jgi:hypothetical protein
LTSKKLNGYLDRQRETLAALDEAIENARAMSKAGKGKKGKGDHEALQWSKQLLNLVAQRSSLLADIKCHLLGRDETGTPTEPGGFYDGNPQVMYERDFETFLAPWTQEDLKLTCEDCNKHSEDVSTRHFSIPREYYNDDEYYDLCTKCYGKRAAKDERTDESGSSQPAPEEDTVSLDSGLEAAMTGAVHNTIMLVRLDGHSPAEKIKTLEDFKASICQTAKENRSEHVLAPGLVMLDMEIQRLQAEAGKGQDAAGTPTT